MNKQNDEQIKKNLVINRVMGKKFISKFKFFYSL